MSKYDNIKDLKNEDFRRLTGVKKETFELIDLLLNSISKMQTL